MTVQVELNKYYIDGSGNKVGPMQYRKKNGIYPWYGYKVNPLNPKQEEMETYADNGQVMHQGPTPEDDLVGEWPAGVTPGTMLNGLLALNMRLVLALDRYTGLVQHWLKEGTIRTSDVLFARQQAQQIAEVVGEFVSTSKMDGVLSKEQVYLLGVETAARIAAKQYPKAPISEVEAALVEYHAALLDSSRYGLNKAVEDMTVEELREDRRSFKRYTDANDQIGRLAYAFWRAQNIEETVVNNATVDGRIQGIVRPLPSDD